MLENNVTLNIVDTDGDEIYAKSGCVINLMNGDIDLTYQPNVTVNNTGTGSVLTTVCNPIAYDYSSVGGPGSCVSSGVSEPVLADLSIYPSPFASQLIVAGLETAGEARLYNVVGDEVASWKLEKGENKLHTAHLPSGAYWLQVRTETGSLTRKLIKT